MRILSKHLAVRVIQEEHDQIGAVLHGMQYFVDAAVAGRPAPDFKVFRAMLLYIADYPDRIHHPKEDAFLFARLRQRTDRLDSVLDTLDAQHRQGDLHLHALEKALTRFEIFGDAARDGFAQGVREYAAFYFSHMRTEEDDILPAAIELLTAEDWQEIDTAFTENAEQRKNVPKDGVLEKLFSLIVKIAPPPIGVGPER